MPPITTNKYEPCKYAGKEYHHLRPSSLQSLDQVKLSENELISQIVVVAGSFSAAFLPALFEAIRGGLSINTLEYNAVNDFLETKQAGMEKCNIALTDFVCSYNIHPVSPNCTVSVDVCASFCQNVLNTCPGNLNYFPYIYVFIYTV